MANLLWFRTYYSADIVVNLDLMTRADLSVDDEAPNNSTLVLRFDHENSVQVESGAETVRVWKALLLSLPANQQALIQDQRLLEKLEKAGSG